MRVELTWPDTAAGGRRAGAQLHCGSLDERLYKLRCSLVTSNKTEYERLGGRPGPGSCEIIVSAKSTQLNADDELSSHKPAAAAAAAIELAVVVPSSSSACTQPHSIVASWCRQTDTHSSQL